MVRGSRSAPRECRTLFQWKDSNELHGLAPGRVCHVTCPHSAPNSRRQANDRFDGVQFVSCDAMPNAEQVLRDAVRALKDSDAVDHPHLGKEQADAEELLEHVLGKAPESDTKVSPEALRLFRRLVARRARGEPPPYITGQTTFLDLTLEVGRGAFIPRQSSEFMAGT